MLQQVNILLVDDNEDDIELIREAFEEHLLLTVLWAAHDGEEALRFLGREGRFVTAIRPGLILMDINMPGKNGFEVLEVLKADPHLKHIPVVMLTSSDRDEDVVRSYQNGAAAHLRKPTDLDSLRQMARQFAEYWTAVAQIPPGAGSP